MSNRYTQEAFNQYYHTNLQEKVKEVEKQRTKSLEKLKKSRNRTIIFLLIYLIITIVIIEESPILFFPLLTGGAVVFIISYGIPYTREKNKLVFEVKTSLIREIIKFLDSSLRYDPKGYMSESLFHQANLFKKEIINEYGGEDYVYGEINSGGNRCRTPTPYRNRVSD